LVLLVILSSRFLLPKSGALWSSEISFNLVCHYISCPIIDEKGAAQTSTQTPSKNGRPKKLDQNSLSLNFLKNTSTQFFKITSSFKPNHTNYHLTISKPSIIFIIQKKNKFVSGKLKPQNRKSPTLLIFQFSQILPYITTFVKPNCYHQDLKAN
jgi:hypothetical protein